MDASDLSLEKFGSIGGDYFEILIAIALDELGYVEGDSYIPSWHKKCVPGTWIEADFIITDKKAKHRDPLNHPKFVFAVGHATSENSAQMKFHRDVEQLLEVKALPNGDDIMVVDILFCCPRETMGGWSSDLIAINEAIFDDHLIVWKYDWGLGLLKCLQDDVEKLSAGKNESVKKKNINNLLKKRKSFRRHFDYLKAHIKKIVTNRKSRSKIHDMFLHEREKLPGRLKIPLLITSKAKTEYKRGLIQVLALNDWELKLLYENHHEWLNGGTKPLEKIALESGMSQEEFDEWWERLDLLSIKIGTCERKLNEYEDDILSEDTREYGFFFASKPLGYVFEHFDLEALLSLSNNIEIFAPNLSPYILELNNLKLFESWMNKLRSSLPCDAKNFHQFIISSKIENSEYKSLKYFESGMAVLCTSDSKFSYDRLAKATGHPKLIQQSDYARFFARGQRRLDDEKAIVLCETLKNLLKDLPEKAWQSKDCTEKFIYRRLDGMVKQHRGGVLDALLGAQIRTFANSLRSQTIPGTNHSVKSCLTHYAITDRSGVNVEIPYIIVLPDKRRIFIHRVNANEGHAADKRKEFSSKIRSIRYRFYKNKIIQLKNLFCSILIIDGKWVLPKSEDPFAHIKMLTVAGWDYVVYPDWLSKVFDEIRRQLSPKEKIKSIIIPEDEPLPLAAETEKPLRVRKAIKTK